MTRSEHETRVHQYLSSLSKPVKLMQFLGEGTDGAVWATSRNTAIKAFDQELGYLNERDAYLRLAEYGVTQKLNEFWLPGLVDWDDDLMIIEMDLMQKLPYIIDFAKVKIDRPTDFSEDVLDYHERRGLELFEDHWPAVKNLMAALESFQIYYLDPRPHNIVFPKRDEGVSR